MLQVLRKYLPLKFASITFFLTFVIVSNGFKVFWGVKLVTYILITHRESCIYFMNFLSYAAVDLCFIYPLAPVYMIFYRAYKYSERVKVEINFIKIQTIYFRETLNPIDFYFLCAFFLVNQVSTG